MQCDNGIHTCNINLRLESLVTLVTYSLESLLVTVKCESKAIIVFTLYI